VFILGYYLGQTKNQVQVLRKVKCKLYSLLRVSTSKLLPLIPKEFDTGSISLRADSWGRAAVALGSDGIGFKQVCKEKEKKRKGGGGFLFFLRGNRCESANKQRGETEQRTNKGVKKGVM